MPADRVGRRYHIEVAFQVAVRMRRFGTWTRTDDMSRIRKPRGLVVALVARGQGNGGCTLLKRNDVDVRHTRGRIEVGLAFKFEAAGGTWILALFVSGQEAAH